MTEDQNEYIKNISQSLENIDKTLIALLDLFQQREAAFKERKREGFGDRKPPFRKSFDRDGGGERGGYRKREEGGGGGYRGRSDRDEGGFRGRGDDDRAPRKSFAPKKPYERTKRTSDAPRKRYNSED